MIKTRLMIGSALLATFMLACGEDAEEDGPPCEALGATWRVHVLADAVPEYDRGGPILVSEDGRIDAVFQMKDPSNPSAVGKFIVSRYGDRPWSTPQPIGEDYRSFRSVSVIAVGDTLHAAWVRTDEIDAEDDIYYATGSASGVWSTPVNLTEDLADIAMRHALWPQLAAASDGRVAVAWSSRDDVPSIFLGRIDGGTLSADPVAVAPTEEPDARCTTEPSVRFDADDHLHATARCVGVADPSILNDPPLGLYVVTDSSGAWESEMVTRRGKFLNIDVDSDDTVHASWIEGWDCGDDYCAETDVFYARRQGSWADRVPVAPNLYGEPLIAFSEGEGVFVAYTGQALPGTADPACADGVGACLSVSTDGAAFASACALPTPEGAVRTREPQAMEVAPDTGLPVVTYTFNLPSGEIGLAIAQLVR